MRSLKKIANRIFNPNENKTNVLAFKVWINSVVELIDDDLIVKLKQEADSAENLGRATFPLIFDCDMELLSRVDLASLRPALEKLYDVCKKYDVALDIENFDILNTKSYHFLITIDVRYPHNYTENPYRPLSKIHDEIYAYIPRNRAHKDQSLKYLQRYIEDKCLELESNIDDIKKVGSKAYFTSENIDFEACSRKDLKKLRPALRKLHHLCKKNNMALDLAGFDILPRTTLVSPGSSKRDAFGFMISVDTTRPYQHASNPYGEIIDVPVQPLKKGDFKPQN